MNHNYEYKSKRIAIITINASDSSWGAVSSLAAVSSVGAGVGTVGAGVGTVGAGVGTMGTGWWPVGEGGVVGSCSPMISQCSRSESP